MPRFGRRTFLVGAAALGLAGCAPKAALTGAPAQTGPTSDGSTKHAPSTTTTAAPTTSETTAPPEPTTSAAVAPGAPARYIRTGDANRLEVALTFHTNGDAGLVERLADVLAQNKVPATLFAVGEWLDANPNLAARLVADGHEFANHTHTHPALGEADPPTIAREIADCRQALTRVLGNGGRWFRPSGIDVPTEQILVEAAAGGYPTVIGYSVDSLDNTDPGVGAIVSNVASELVNGSIVSLHTGHEQTIEALPALLTLLRDRGLQPVTVSALLR